MIYLVIINITWLLVDFGRETTFSVNRPVEHGYITSLIILAHIFVCHSFFIYLWLQMVVCLLPMWLWMLCRVCVVKNGLVEYGFVVDWSFLSLSPLTSCLVPIPLTHDFHRGVSDRRMVGGAYQERTEGGCGYKAAAFLSVFGGQQALNCTDRH